LIAVAYSSPLILGSINGIPFKPCGSGDLSITDVDISPNPPVAGQDLKISSAGALASEVTAGEYEFDISLDGIPIHSEKGDLCKFGTIQCPIKPGSTSFIFTESLPSFVPSGSYKITVKGKQQDSKQLFCVEVDMKLNNEQDYEHAHSRAIIDMVNTRESTWTAGVSNRFFANTIDEVKDLCGTLPGPKPDVVIDFPDSFMKALNIPDTFDSREEWGTTCPSTKEIRDQGACGSCWAVGAASAMTDRVCIASKGANAPHLSSEDLVSCCGFSCGFGCQGGFPIMAWNYFQGTGLVSGGPWNSKQGCYPYQIESCDHHVNGTRKPCGSVVPTPACSQKCQNEAVWEQDKHKGVKAYGVPADVAKIQAEIMQNGPVEAAFSVYADFVSYRSGVYKHVTGQMLGGHAVKMIGWGVESGSPYWLISNSWNEDWGDKGLFKIARGNNECGIESGIVAGLPA